MADLIPFEMLLDNKYYKTRLIFSKNCSSPTLVLHCTDRHLPEKAPSCEFAVVDFSGDLQSKCLDAELDWIDASSDEWMNDLKEYLECFPWPAMDRCGKGHSVHEPLPLGLLNEGISSDDEIDQENSEQDKDDLFDFETTLRELQDIKIMASKNVDNRAEVADRIAKALGLTLSLDH